MKEFLLADLANRGPTFLREAPDAIPPLIRLLVRIVKLGWLDGPQNQNITENVEQFLNASTLHYSLGVEIYTQLAQDMQPSSGQGNRFRRTALSFRDTSLPKLFTAGLRALQQIQSGEMSIPNENERHGVLRNALKLTCASLSFDFMGTVPDETSDDQATIMVPNSWSMLRDESIASMFFGLYEGCVGSNWSACADLCLQNLVLFASLRRSFFQKDDMRSKNLGAMITGTAKILQNRMGLRDPACAHSFCRLLGKINTAHQLSEMSLNSSFKSWIEQVFQFTMDNLKNWQVAHNSQHYLLSFWSQLVAPVIVLRENAPPSLEVKPPNLEQIPKW